MKTEIPEGYKNTPVGIIPEEWEVKRLEEIAEIKSGATPSRKITDNWNGNIPWVTTSLLNNAKILSAEEYITQTGLDNSATKILPLNTVLMAMYGQGQTRGKVSILCIEAATNQACAALIINSSTRYDYIFYQLSNMYDIIRNLSNDGSQKNLNLQLIKNIQVTLPPLPEQQKIAKILSVWDIAIEKLTLLIEKLELRKHALMRQLLTGKKRLKGFDGEWKNLELSEILKYEQPTKYLVKDTNYNDKYNTPVLTAGKTFILGYTNEKENIYNELPVIIFDDFTTETKYVEFPFKVKSSAMKVLHSKGNGNLKFIFESMQLIEYQIGGHERHWISKYSYLTIKIPSSLEQDTIAEIFSTADKEIDSAKAKLDLFKMQKKGLMQILLKGKKRVRI